MPKFSYVARDNTNRKITGVEEAASTDELIGRLQSRQLLVVNLVLESSEERTTPKQEISGRHIQLRRYRVTQGDLVLFCRQLATLLGAGVTILKSLDIISKQVSSKKFYNTIKELEKGMQGGLSLHDAMARHPRVFSELWVNLAESGEASGNLAIVLDRLASFLERNAEFKNRIISSLIYPVILMIAGFGALFFLTIKIIPNFAEIFKGFNVTLPFLTRVLIEVSRMVRKGILPIMGIIIFSFFMIRKYIKTKEGRIRFEKLQFSLPIFGDFFRALVVERFSSGMATLIESGVPLLYSLEITEHSVGNLIMSDIVHQIKEDVREGKPLHDTLEKSDFFEPLVVQMVAVGEEIGELPQMLRRINKFYQEQVETFLTRFTAMFEPMMLIFMGLIIGTMVVGMFLPIFQLASMGQTK